MARLKGLSCGSSLIVNESLGGKNVSKRFFSETTRTIETKLPRNDHWNSSTHFLFFMPIGNLRWPPPQDIVLTLDPIGKVSQNAL